MATLTTPILATVAVIRRRWLILQLGLWLIGALTGTLAWLLMLCLLDNLAMFTSAQLVLAWVIGTAAHIVGLSWLMYRLTRGRPGPVQLAKLYERRAADGQSRLVTAVDFLVSGQAERDPFARAAVEENVRHLQPAWAAQAVDPRSLQRNGWALAGVALLFLLYVLLQGAWAGNAWSRLMHPLDPPAHRLATSIVVTPGDIEVNEGQAVLIRAQLGQHLPPAADIEYRMGSLGWTTAAMRAPTLGSATASALPRDYQYAGFTGIYQPITYRIRAGRSVSPDYRITVAARPRLDTLQLTLEAPAYAGRIRQPLKPGVGDVTALVGSTIQLDFSSDRPLASAALELSTGKKIPLHLSIAEPRAAHGAFTLEPGLSGYVLSFTDSAGLANVPLRYTLTPLDDQPPLAIIARPGRDVVLPRDSRLEVAIEAQDDVGLAGLILQARPGTAGGNWRDVQKWDVPERTRKHKTVTAELRLDAYKLKVGDTLLYRVVATDHREPTANTYVGRSWSITLAKEAGNQTLLAAEARRLIDLLTQALILQRENRTAVDMDQTPDPIRAKQVQVRDLTQTSLDLQRQGLKPDPKLTQELTNLIAGPMTQALSQLQSFDGPYPKRLALKPGILQTMDQIIRRLEAILGAAQAQLAGAERAELALAKLSPQDKEQALQQVREVLEKLRQFAAEQDKAIADTEELARKAPNFTKEDLQAFDRLKGTEDRWAEVFAGSVKDISKLTEQGFADTSIANDYKEMIEQIEEAAKNLNPKMITLAIPREQAGREMATKLAEDMEMWLPSTPDNIKWVMEEPLDRPEIPMPPLPDELSDLIGDLISDQEKLAEEADDVTSAWADSMSAAGWGVSDGPISNFSAKGKTGNQLPNNNELSGRSGEGRTGRSQGQMVQDVARGLDGRKTPTRVTNDPYEQGVVKELQQQPTGGATGGGKMRGGGQEGLQGSTPPPLAQQMQTMKDWQQRLRQQAQQVANQLKSVPIVAPNLQRAIELMKKAEQAAGDGRYQDMAQAQQMVLHELRMTVDTPTRAAALHMDRAVPLPADQRRQVLEAGDEPVPQEYRDAVRRYFENLSEDK